eukprot:TRINITY_DN896_c2_g1_i1.p1 TRINITY_DN896_c2_g1~~TRINITY_DN896_c2_g1_i1.p1  ORF type:complete len:1082 (+),score=249.37 TRINITY_DN896_c2_g1_i1:448-3693(+)
MAHIRTSTVFAGHDTTRVLAYNVHPFKPWVVTVCESSNVVIWDYADQKVVHEFNINCVDEEKRNEKQLQQYVDKGPNYKPPKETTGKKEEKGKIGVVKCVKFVDRDTCRYKKVVEHSRSERRRQAQATTATPGMVDTTLPTQPDAPFWAHTNFVVVITEYRVIFFDYVTTTIEEVRPSALESKFQMCVEHFVLSPLLAFGGSDGIIRLWNFAQSKPHGKLAGAHKAVVAVFAFMSDNVEYLLSAGAEGNICLWDLVTNENKPHKVFAGSDLIQLSFNPLTSKATFLCDKTIHLWDPYTHEAVKTGTKAKFKEQFTSGGAFPHPRFPSSSSLVTVKNDSKVYVTDQAGNMRELFDAAELYCAKGAKDKKMLFSVEVHPLHPHIVFCNTKFGLIVLHVDEFCSPDLAARTGLQSESKPVMYIVQDGQIVSQELSSLASARTKNAVVNLENYAYMRLHLSPSGRYITSMAQDHRTFDVWEVATGRRVDQGIADSFAWAGVRCEGNVDRYAVLGPAVVEDTGKGKKKTKKGGSRGVPGGKKDSRIGKGKGKASALSVNSAASAGGLQLRIKELGGGDLPRVIMDRVSVDKPIRLFGGLLLGVVMARAPHPGALDQDESTSTPADTKKDKATARGQTTARQVQTARNSPGMQTSRGVRRSLEEPTDADNSALQFLNWTDLKVVGNKLPTPVSILWDPTEHFCLMTYPTYFCVFSVSPSFKLLCCMHVRVTSAVWFNRALIYCTAVDVGCLFPLAEDLGPILLASLNPLRRPFDHHRRDLSKLTSSLITCQPRPIGSLSVVAVVDELLFLLDAEQHIHPVSLSHPALKFYFVAGGGCTEDALRWASWVHDKHHDNLGQFMVALGYAKEATQLSGLSTLYKLHICLKYSLIETAVGILDEVVPTLEKINERQEDSNSRPALGEGGSLANSTVDEGVADLVTARQKPTRAQLLDQCLLIAAAADEANELRLAEQLYLKAALIDPEAHRHLVIHYVKNNLFDELRTLYRTLTQQNLHDCAKFAAAFLDEDLFVASLEQGSNFSEAVAFLDSNNNNNKNNKNSKKALVKRWNESLRASETEGAEGTIVILE